MELVAGPLKQHRGRLGGYSLCCLCGKPAFATDGFSLWCLSCLQPFILKGLDYIPQVTVRRAATRRREPVPA